MLPTSLASANGVLLKKLPPWATSIAGSGGGRRWLRPVIALFTIIFLVYGLSGGRQRAPPADVAPLYNFFNSTAPSTHITPDTPEAFEFWELFAYAVSQGEPNFPEVTFVDPKHESWELFLPDEQHARIDNIKLEAPAFQSLKNGIKAAIKDAKFLAPRLPFVRGTRGIVLTANNDALSVLITSLRVIRKTGSQLPVEVFLDEYEEPACERILPSLGAKCLFMKDKLPVDKEHPLDGGHFMAKVGAIVLSSFEQVLFIDCDMFPVNNPDSLFVTEPFRSKGFVLWPDYWADTASHYFYELIEHAVPPTNERAATESGALLINKKTHGEALFLAAFFNHYGSRYWYHLLSQNSPGKGDKETWLGSIRALNLPFYTVNERPGHVGYRCDGKATSVATAQHHPNDDWIIADYGVRRGRKDTYLADCPKPRVLFIHGNLPKYDAPAVLHWKIETVNWVNMQRCNDGKAHRMWGPKELNVATFGWDVEKTVWDSMRWLACEHEFDIGMWVNGTWHSDVQQNVCAETVEFYDELLGKGAYDPSLPKYPTPERPWGGHSPDAAINPPP